MEKINNEFILQMIDITKEFPGVKALDKVSLNVRPGTVHALMGENGAGKSTLMKCLFGIYQKNSGHIYFDGREIEFQNTRQALDNGVSMVHQELNQVRQRNILDNIWLGRYPKKGLFIDEEKMYKDTVEIFKDLDKRGCYVMLSNYNTKLIKELYKDFNFNYVEAQRNIGASSKNRGNVEEVIITNYKNTEGFNN